MDQEKPIHIHHINDGAVNCDIFFIVEFSVQTIDIYPLELPHRIHEFVRTKKS